MVEVFQSQDKGGEEELQAQGPRVQEGVKKNCKRKARACWKAWPRASRCWWRCSRCRTRGGELQAQGPRVQEGVKKNCKHKARACRKAWPRASRC
ncbi:hypothetical protein PF003_g19095 [Phytophthora fragariae]|nr:hypothetical protein PF003_g19095 [Phytophthora fragariae]